MEVFTGVFKISIFMDPLGGKHQTLPIFGVSPVFYGIVIKKTSRVGN